MKNLLIPGIVCAMILSSCVNTNSKKDEKSVADSYSIKEIPFNQVSLSDGFWLPKIETNREVTIPASFAKCEEMGRMDNFLIAGGKMEGTTKGEMPFDDTDVYKIIEGASYSLTTTPDKSLEHYVDSIISIIAVGQENDGYLTTWKTIDPSNPPATWCPAGARWEGMSMSHELYNSGHLFEAASAHYKATGKTNLLDIAIKNADLLVNVFGKGGKLDVPGHQIVETGLVKLYLITKKQEYLELARHFLDLRGDSSLRDVRGAYWQDHLPVLEQKEVVGHAVRAAYMYAGMTDIAALYNDVEYQKSVDTLWENMVNKKMYITGGIGSLHKGEAFGENYELPNLTAYNETCAAIANVYWCYRMFLLHGESKYIDVLERSLYNGVISGVGLDGKTFFYPNPLECDMEYQFNQGNTITRQPWFDCSCCPTNLCRFMPSVPGYIYAHKNDAVYVNLFIQSSSNIQVGDRKIHVSQETNYPWNGDVKIKVVPEKETELALCLRIPGWAQNKPLPGDLYYYKSNSTKGITLKVNGEAVDFKVRNGYAVLARSWKKGDYVEYSLPMDVRMVKANEKVEDDLGKVALERGPIVYCVEEIDNSDINQLVITDNMQFSHKVEAFLSKDVELIVGKNKSGDDMFTAIPYFLWNNRGANKMKVWLPEKNEM
ncbi:glycoside hydrolase family 127 protein [Plebeiibacterium marinum]|uniref:Glycoside hydrolase family 127 protein n=1 Tax=Plebeiibacterium marinum TaxID=2992111 RepID=A0AAE3SKC1_9BACT|nr:glycoside hydrolase family 127 protein [Plebeiobacterium marinum]MCW3806660.1 glycoside hydrolase family 127 protein [Plebeiobacterium marinum]